MSPPPAVTFREVEQLLQTGFTGQITLHCHEGKIVRYVVAETRLPGQPTLSQPPPKQ